MEKMLQKIGEEVLPGVSLLTFSRDTMNLLHGFTVYTSCCFLVFHPFPFLGQWAGSWKLRGWLNWLIILKFCSCVRVWPHTLHVRVDSEPFSLSHCLFRVASFVDFTFGYVLLISGFNSGCSQFPVFLFLYSLFWCMSWCAGILYWDMHAEFTNYVLHTFVIAVLYATRSRGEGRFR